MRIERDAEGNFTLDPDELASRFGLASDDFRSRMQRGVIVSTVEEGRDDDAGTFRLNVRLGNRLWRAVVDADRNVKTETMTFVKS